MINGTGALFQCLAFRCVHECPQGGLTPDLGGEARGPGAPAMFTCLAISTTCACHLVIFSEKSWFVDASRSAKQQYFTLRIFDIVAKQL